MKDKRCRPGCRRRWPWIVGLVLRVDGTPVWRSPVGGAWLTTTVSSVSLQAERCACSRGCSGHRPPAVYTAFQWYVPGASGVKLTGPVGPIPGRSGVKSCGFVAGARRQGRAVRLQQGERDLPAGSGGPVRGADRRIGRWSCRSVPGRVAVPPSVALSWTACPKFTGEATAAVSSVDVHRKHLEALAGAAGRRLDRAVGGVRHVVRPGVELALRQQ